jgi:thymidylate synthase
MQNYKDILNTILTEGDAMSSRAGNVTRISHEFIFHDLRDGFPLISGRQMFVKGIIGELICFLRGYTNIDEYKKRGCNFWDANLEDWNNKNGTPNNKDLGPIYAKQLRNFNGVDQLRSVIEEAKINPTSRRLLVNYWNPAEMNEAVLPCCHYSWQISVVGDYLDLIFNMRSVDCALGMPSDLVHYGLLAHLIGNEIGKTPRHLTGVFADCHIYDANLDGVKEYLTRPTFKKPTLKLNCPQGMPVEEFEVGMVEFEGYQHAGPINMGKMAV